MAKFALVGKHSTDNPTLAGMPFVMANAAAESGHEVSVCLLGDGVLVLKDSVAESTVPVGYGPIKEQLEAAVRNGVRIFV